MKKALFILLLLSGFLNAQNTMFNSLAFSNIGPTVMSGRIVDLAVNPDNPTEFYAAYATGGVWYTNNNGTSFTPIMDSAPTLNCGTIAVDWISKTIWVGTGEVNASRSSYAGVGVLKSVDNGKTWINIGLADSHHISRIWFNPNNTNELIVGAVGHLYTANSERGVFKTTDGGVTWQKTLFVNDNTGVIDISVSKNNPKTMFAATWQKDRKAWNFNGNGQGSGIYKSVDSGNSWNLISTATSGFPVGENIGRIGLCAVNSETIYAVLDNQNKRPNTKTEISKDSNKAMIETNVIGCEIYKSVNGGLLWTKQNKNFIDDLYYTYGYYFANIAVNPSRENQIYVGGVNLLSSNDNGASFMSISKNNVHSDHHITWINPKNANHIINGNDGGVNISYDKGENWIKCNNQAVGQFYSINVDNQPNYNVYGGLQDNGVWCGPNNYKASAQWHQTGQYPYKEILGGDGMQVQIDSRNSNIVFAGSQYGAYYKIDRTTDKEQEITPTTEKDQQKLRFNWQTPILLSSHNQDILYFGSNFLHRSMNQGTTWDKISPDLTKGVKEGNVSFGTITTIAESKFSFGLLYAGSDDGQVHVTKDGGSSWQLISNSLPQNLWVSRVVASKYKKERVYITLSGYRNDNFKSYIYISDDYGTSWKNIASDKNSAANVLIEDTENQNILYLGTDNGLQISLNKGETWNKFSDKIPAVAVHDLVIQSKAKELIVGTHGRSLYKTDVSNIQLLTDDLLKKPIHLFAIDNINKTDRWGDKSNAWAKVFEPELAIWFFLKAKSSCLLTIKNNAGIVVHQREIRDNEGLLLENYNLSINEAEKKLIEKNDSSIKIIAAKNGKFYLPTGKYTVTISDTEKNIQTTTFEIVKDDKKPKNE